MLLAGDFFLGAVVAAALTKLVLRLRTLGLSAKDLNRRTAEVGPGAALALTLKTLPGHRNWDYLLSSSVHLKPRHYGRSPRPPSGSTGVGRAGVPGRCC